MVCTEDRYMNQFLAFLYLFGINRFSYYISFRRLSFCYGEGVWFFLGIVFF